MQDTEDGLRITGEVDDATPSTASPSPLPPPPSQAEVELKRHRLATIVGAVALIAGVIVGLGIFAAFNSLSDSSSDSVAGSTAEAAAAEVPVTAAAAATTVPAVEESAVDVTPEPADAAALDAVIDLEEQLSATTEDLTAAEEDLTAIEEELELALADNEQLRSELEAGDAEDAEANSSAASLAAALATIADLTAKNEAAAAQIAELEAGGGTPASDDPVAPAPTPVAGSDVNNVPEFAKFVGEALGSLNGRNVLGGAQTECLGAAVAADIGLDALGAALNRDATDAQLTVLTESMERSAPGCQVDVTALF